MLECAPLIDKVNYYHSVNPPYFTTEGPDAYGVMRSNNLIQCNNRAAFLYIEKV